MRFLFYLNPDNCCRGACGYNTVFNTKATGVIPNMIFLTPRPSYLVTVFIWVKIMLRLLFLFICLPISAIASDVAALQAQINALKREIIQLDNDISECKSGLKSWTTATVVGAVGTAATGVGAAIQGSMLHKLKKEQQEKDNNQGDKK